MMANRHLLDSFLLTWPIGRRAFNEKRTHHFHLSSAPFISAAAERAFLVKKKKTRETSDNIPIATNVPTIPVEMWNSPATFRWKAKLEWMRPLNIQMANERRPGRVTVAMHAPLLRCGHYSLFWKRQSSGFLVNGLGHTEPRRKAFFGGATTFQAWECVFGPFE